MRRKRTIARRTRRLAIGGLLVVGMLSIGAVSGIAATTINVPVDYGTIQAAINAAADGDTIKVATGTYNEALNITKPVTITGAGATLVTVNVAGLSGYNSSGIYASADNVHLSGLTLVGLKTSALPRYGIKYGQVTGGSLSDIVVENVYRSGFDLLGVSNMAVTDIVAQNNGGHGIALTDCNNVTVTNLSTSGNGWQSVSVATWGRYSPIGTSGIVFQGSINLGQVFQLEQGQYPSGPPEPITFSTDPADGADVTVPESLFAYALVGDDDESPAYQRVYFFDSLTTAEGAAAYPGALGHLEVAGRYIQSIVDPTQLFVSTGCSVQAAIDAGTDDYVVHVNAIALQEQIEITSNEALIGSGSSTIIESPDALTLYFMTGTNKNYPIIYVHDTNDALIQDLVVDGLGKGNANYRFSGIAFFNAGGRVDSVEVRNIENTPFSGAQHGIGIYAFNEDGVTRTLTITNCNIHDFQKNAMALSGTGLTVDVSGNNVVLGEGQTAVIAQNGIQVGSGAGGVISDNTVGSVWYTGPNWGSTGILILDAADGIQILNNTLDACQFGIYIDSTTGAIIEGNDLTGSQYGLILYSPDATVTGNSVVDSSYGIYYAASSLDDFALNEFTGNYVALYMNGGESELHYNSIVGNTYGLYNTGSLLDATLNWWGDNDGPSGAGGGAGDWVSDNVIFSPWLGINPDGDAGTVGVQLVSPLLFVVDDIGPAPALGYLGAAIDAANMLPGIDSIEVRHGTYDASEPITDGVNIYSEVGSASSTFLNGPISINVSNVLLGKMRQGFTINGDITVGAGIDASNIHINWNDLLGIVVNNGTGTLDAIFNYWGEDGPDTVGDVAIYPLLPIPSDTIIGYMDKHGLSALDAIDFATLLDLYLSERNALAAVELMNAFGFSSKEAATLVKEYGALAVDRALAFCGGDYEDFLALLVGYASGGGGGGSFLGGGVGGTTAMPGFCVGCSVPLQLELVHPITGEPITDAVVSYSVCKTLPDGTAEIVALGVMTYDGDLGAYTFDVDTTGYEPGIYDIYLGTDDGRSRHFQVEVVLIGV